MLKIQRLSVLFIMLIAALFLAFSDAHAAPIAPPGAYETPILEDGTGAHKRPLLEGGPCADTVTVRAGHTLGQIAVMCRTTVQALLDSNPQIENPNIIYVGQQLAIPEYEGPPIYTTNVAELPAAARPDGVGPDERWINVDLRQQLLVAYEGDTPVLQSQISGGLPQYPTVTGQFRFYSRYVSKDMDGRPLGFDYYLRDVPYPMYFYKAYAIHGTYWHANFGTPMSHGCVNLPTPVAEWIFNWSDESTLINIHT